MAANKQELVIELRQVKFFGYHGAFHSETHTGGDFEVNLLVTLQPKLPVITSLHETTDYVRLFELVKRRMQIPTPLLETLTMEIAEEIGREFRDICAVEISICKCNPPMTNFSGRVAVTYRKQF